MGRYDIAARLRIALGVLIIVLLTIGWLGLRQMAQINANLEEIVNKRWVKVKSAREVLAYSNLNNRLTMEIFFLMRKGDIHPLLSQRAENSAKISALVNKIEQQVESAKEKELLESVSAARTPYVNSYMHGIDLLLNKQNYDEAQRNMVQETLPLLLRYHNAWNAYVDFQGEQMDEAAHASTVSYDATRKLTLVLIILSVLVAAAIAVFITRSLTAEIAQRQRAEEALRDAETRYRSLLEELPAVPYVAEPGAEGEWLYVSPRIESLLGFTPAEWMADRHLWTVGSTERLL